MELCLLVVNRLSYLYYYFSLCRVEVEEPEFVPKEEVYVIIPQMALKRIIIFLSVGWM